MGVARLWFYQITSSHAHVLEVGLIKHCTAGFKMMEKVCVLVFLAALVTCNLAAECHGKVSSVRAASYRCVYV